MVAAFRPYATVLAAAAAAAAAAVPARSFGLSLGSLAAGILLGAALNAWLRVDIVPLGVSKQSLCRACCCCCA